MRRAAAALLLLGGACSAPGSTWPEPETLPAPRAAQAAADARGPRIVLAAPADPAPAATAAETAYLGGWALPPDARVPRLDVVLALDVSGSTAEDVTRKETEGSPLFGQRRVPIERSVLGAELEAARALLEALEPEVGRVAVVVFSGRPYGARVLDPAHTAVPLTRDRDAIDAGLERIRRAGPNGMTHMAAGLERAVAELVGGPRARSEPSPGASRVILLLSDGVPTLPREGFEADNERAVVEVARRAAAYRIRVHAFGVGAGALEGPFALVEMARLTGGEFVPVRDPARLPELLPLVPLTGMRELRVRNLTTGAGALATRLATSGRFDALVALEPGPNRVEITARTRDGAEARRVVELERRPGGPGAPPLPPPWEARRAELADAVALERAERRRIELLGQLREEMEEARSRADRRRRELELEPAPP